MIYKLKNNYLKILSLIYLASANYAFAQFSISNPIGYDSVSDLLGAILGIVVSVGTPIVTIAIIYAGFKFVAARGNAQAIEEAKRTLVYVLIGAAIVLGAQVLQMIISNTVADIQAGS